MGDSTDTVSGVIAVAEDVVRRPTRRATGTLVLEALLLATLALLVAVVVLQLWNARWTEPFNYDSDASYYLMLVRGLGRSGTYLSNAHLGWPLGQHMAAYPEGGDNLHWLELALLVRATGSAGAAVNTFYIGTFATVAAVSHLALRALGGRRLTAGALALLYAFAPYHLARNETHLMLSSYACVPMVVLLAVKVMGGDPLVLDLTSGRIAWRRPRTWLLIAMVVVLASSGSYYFVFGMLLLATAALVGSTVTRSRRPALGAGLLGLIAAVVYTLNLAPSIVERVRHPGAFVVSARGVSETDRWGLRIAQLFLPRDHHRLAPLARLAAASVRRSVLPSEAGQQLGLVLSFGLAAALIHAATRAAGARPTSTDERATTHVAHLGVLAAVCMLAGAIGSLSFAASLAGLRPIRAWNRISIVVAFCAAAATTVLLDRVRQRLAGHRLRPARALAVALPCLVLATGLLDQTSRADRPAYAALHRRINSDRQFYAAIARQVPAGTSVFELPDVAFPEHAQLGTGPYDQARGYLFEPSLHWSFGFLRGSHADWAATLDREPATRWLTTVAAIGFRALVVDRFGYPDHAVALERDIQTVVGPATSTSLDSRYAFYALMNYADQTVRQLGSAGINELRRRALALGPAG